MKRLFLAFEIPEIAKHLIAAIQEDVRRVVRSFYVSWVPESSWHITTHFLGSVSATVEERVVGLVNHWKHAPPELAFWCLTGFPNDANPRVVALKYADPTARALALRGEASRYLTANGIAYDTRTWIPHVSLGRPKHSVDRFRESLSDIRVPECSFFPSAYTLFESTFDKAPSYRPIARHAF